MKRVSTLSEVNPGGGVAANKNEARGKRGKRVGRLHGVHTSLSFFYVPPPLAPTQSKRKQTNNLQVQVQERAKSEGATTCQPIDFDACTSDVVVVTFLLISACRPYVTETTESKLRGAQRLRYRGDPGRQMRYQSAPSPFSAMKVARAGQPAISQPSHIGLSSGTSLTNS